MNIHVDSTKLSCCRCKTFYDKSLFNKNRASKTGYQLICKPCNSIVSRASYLRNTHYKRRKPTEQRFWEKVNKTETCWLWQAVKINGYGQFNVKSRKRTYAHRFSYELLKGKIPESKYLDHLCRVRNCVNPAHLEPVTHRENVLRGEGRAAKNSKKTHCPKGHPYSGYNLCIANDGSRKCRICWLKKPSVL